MKSKKICARDIYFSWVLIGVFALFLMSGLAFSKWLLIGAALSFAAFVVYSLKKLKCPKCGQRENLLRLTLALKRSLFCCSCGQLIQINLKGATDNKDK